MAKYLEPYRQSQRRHGSGFDVTLWASPASQRRRFEVAASMVFLAGKRILDAGCSRGDFAAFLIEREIAFEHYTGVDALCDVIEYAQQRDLPRCSFHCGDFVHDPKFLSIGRPQIIAISGTLNTMTDEEVSHVLDWSWKAAGETLVFNFLSDRVGAQAPPQMGPARRLDTIQLLDWAMEQTPDVAFRQDYFPDGHDATIVMRK